MVNLKILRKDKGCRKDEGRIGGKSKNSKGKRQKQHKEEWSVRKEGVLPPPRQKFHKCAL